MGRRAFVVLLAVLVAALAAAAEPRPIWVEVRAVGGGTLGRLAGSLEGSVAYFALDEAGRLAGGRMELPRGGARALLHARRGSVEVRRDSAVVLVNGRPLGLSAPARVRRGTWLVPGEWLLRALPPLLGTGVQVTAIVPAPPPPRAVARTVSTATPAPAPPAGVTGRAAGERAVAALPESAPAPAPAPPAARPAEAPGPAVSGLELRYHSHPAFTRVVIEGMASGEPELRDTRGGLVVRLGPALGALPRRTEAVRDGLVASLELARAGGTATLHVDFERPPASRRVFRLDDPPRLVLDFYREGPSAGAAPEPAPAAAAPAASVARAPEAEPPAPGEQGTARAGRLELRYRSYPAYTRVVLEGGSPFEPRLVETADGLLVPLAGLGAAVSRTTRAVRDGLVGTLELGESRGAPALRVTFEHAPAARKVFRLQDPPRLVLDFFRAPTPPPAPRSALRTIVIDPGHGGDDPGATGPSGLQEKELTLDVARRLAALVEEEVGLRAILTRTRDEFAALGARTAFANRHQADLFVSIHVNAAPRASAMGTETYFLSSEATDNAARQAAAFENQVIRLERTDRKSRGDGHGVLRSILWDLAQSEFQQESSHLAEALQDSLDRALRLPSRGVKQAPFYVLGGAAMPAVLVEIGFLSNREEEQRLRDDGYRDRIARALAAGLAAYKQRYDQKSGVMAER